ncbi:Isoamyl acetate-hydrolyzing esterase 1 -like protein [Halotydeus destructor]|nr:Isoamyl acetate-hydrolyzing esterase 1 -like protein [Halotydeus destructor]
MLWFKVILLGVSLIAYSVNGEKEQSGIAYRRKYDYSKVILFGSSTTQLSFSRDGQWAALLADRLQRVADVLNRGFSGYNSRWALLMLPKLFPATFSFDDVSCLVIFLGSNDSTKSSATGQGVPIEEYMANMAAIVQYLVDRGLPKDKIVLIAPQKFFVEKWRFGPNSGRDDAITAQYAAACVEVGQVLQVDVLNLHQVFTDSDKGAQLSTDGLHFSAQGSELLFNSLWPLVESRVVKHAGADALTWLFPKSADINRTDPQSTFEAY